MSDEKKPFAEARDGRLIVGGVTVNHTPFEGRTIAGERFAELAALVEAGVELLGELDANLHGVDRLLAGAADAPADQFYEFNPEALRRMHVLVRDALAGRGDYVPRADLDAAEAKLTQMKAAIDALDPGQYANGETVCERLEANGLKKPEPPDTMAMITELRKRGFIVASALAKPKPSEANLLPKF